MNPHRTSEDDFFPEISQVQDADYYTGSEHFLEDIEAEFQQFPPQSLEEFEGHEDDDDDDDDFLESQFAQDSMNQRKTPSNLDIREEDFQNGILWTWWDMLGVRRQTQMMMMAKASGVSRAGNFLRKKKDPTKHPQRIAAGLISSTLIRKTVSYVSSHHSQLTLFVPLSPKQKRNNRLASKCLWPILLLARMGIDV
jgi:hypothetical protein